MPTQGVFRGVSIPANRQCFEKVSPGSEVIKQKIGTKITVTIPDEMLQVLEEIANRHSMTQAEAIRLLVKIGIGHYNIGKISGIAQLADLADHARRKLLKKSTKAAKKKKR